MKKLYKMILIFASILILAGCEKAVDYSETMFRGNLRHTGIYETTGVETFSGVKWKFNTDGMIFSSPVLSGGSLFFGSNDGYLYSLNKEDGSLNWKYKTGGEVASVPAISDGKVFFASRNGFFYALDAQTGEDVWKFQTGGESKFGAVDMWGLTPKGKYHTDPWDFFLSSAAVYGNKVFFGSGDGNIYALDTKTGKEVWKFKTGLGVHSSPAVYEGVLYCGSWDSNIYALNPETGGKIWEYNTGNDEKQHLYEGVQSSPAIVDGILYAGSRSARLVALDAKTGELKWEHTTGGPWICASPGVYDGRVYVGTSDAYNLLCLDAKTGKLIFEYPTGAWVFSSASVANNTVYFGCHNARFYAVDASTGDLKWMYQTEDQKENADLYYTEDGKINSKAMQGEVDMSNTAQYVIDQVFKTILSGGSILSSPVIDNGVVYFGSTDGNLYALH